MKKIAVIIGIAFSISSCKNCVDCSAVGGQAAKQCKTDYEARSDTKGIKWSTYRNALVASGCKSVN